MHSSPPAGAACLAAYFSYIALLALTAMLSIQGISNNNVLRFSLAGAYRCNWTPRT